jgi:hypothetical protein
MSATYLLVPDAHVMAGDDLARFRALHKWLGARNVRLEGLINIGDLWDFASLCAHDQDNPEWYSRQLGEEIDVGIEALELQNKILKDFGIAGAVLHFIEGNHENRYNKWMAGDNRLRTSPFPKTVADIIKSRLSKPARAKLKFHKFLQPAIVRGVAFSHYFVSGLMARPQSGERPAGTILKTQHMSCVCGHSHTLDFAERTRADSTKIYGLVAGCFVDPKAEFGFAGPARKLWWSGCHLLHFTGTGQFDLESVSYERLLNA